MPDTTHTFDPRFPVLDIGIERDSSGYEKLVNDFLHTYSTIGFGAIINHGIDSEVITRVFAASKEFHEQPLREKNKYTLDKNHRGYIAINTSTDVNSKLDNVTLPNQSESFMLMREDTDHSRPVVDGAYLAGQNQWPCIDGFKDAVTAGMNSAEQVAKKLISVTADALKCDRHTLDLLFDPPTLWFRLLHYPPGPQNAPDNLYGSAPHTDFGAFTLLFQDNTGGLQVKHPNGRWIDVPCIPGAIIVNVGDMLERLSNGILRSTPHRVVNRSAQERYSYAFFYDPYVETVITPLPGCISAALPNKFDPLNFGEFLRGELEASYTQHSTSANR